MLFALILQEPEGGRRIVSTFPQKELAEYRYARTRCSLSLKEKSNTLVCYTPRLSMNYRCHDSVGQPMLHKPGSLKCSASTHGDRPSTEVHRRGVMRPDDDQASQDGYLCTWEPLWNINYTDLCRKASTEEGNGVSTNVACQEFSQLMLYPTRTHEVVLLKQCGWHPPSSAFQRVIQKQRIMFPCQVADRPPCCLHAGSALLTPIRVPWKAAGLGTCFYETASRRRDEQSGINQHSQKRQA